MDTSPPQPNAAATTADAATSAAVAAAARRPTRASSCCTQIRLLLWKKRVMAVRSWRATLVELIIPLLFLIAFNAPGLSKAPNKVPAADNVTVPNASTALGLISSLVSSPVFPPVGPYDATYVPSAWAAGVPALAYAPNSSARAARVMSMVKTHILSDRFSPVPLLGFADEAALVRHYEAHPMTVWAGVVFSEGADTSAYTDADADADAGTDTDALANAEAVNWRYSIRINGSFAAPTDPDAQFVHRGHLGGASKYDWLRYHQTGFLLLQYAIDQAIIAEVTQTGGRSSLLTDHASEDADATTNAYLYRPPAVPRDPASYACFLKAAADQTVPKCNITANVGFRAQPHVLDATTEPLWIFKWLPGWCLNVAAVFCFSAQLVPLVRERRHRSPLALMGLRDAAMQASFLCYGAIVALPTACLFAFAWRLVHITSDLSSFTLVAFFMFSYLVALSSFASAVAPLFSGGEDRITQLGFLGCFFVGLTYVGALVGTGTSSGRGAGALKLSLSGLPFGAAHLGGELIMGLEGRNIGLTWHSVAVSGAGGEPSMAELFTVVWCSVGMWSFVARYLDAVMPDPEHGDSRHPCFCITDLRWFCCRNRRVGGGRPQSPLAMRLLDTAAGSSGRTEGAEEGRYDDYYDNPFDHDGGGGDDEDADEEKRREEGFGGRQNHEPIGVALRARIRVRVRDLTKIYRRGVCGAGGDAPKVAVSGLNVDLVEGQIFSLLGHNGAGKTTSINSITHGTMTSGSVGYDFRDRCRGQRKRFYAQDPLDRPVIRTRIGVCPQHNVLWDQCTPREHLRFFARLKGVPDGEVEKEVVSLLARIRLPDGDNDRPVGEFSGGNQRKVSLAVAMVGDPDVVFLDEPTAGMDPASRRGVWDLLQGFKSLRVIVLCTHFMDEADMLGDRIGIMCRGRMVCSGSSLFLKHKFGRGYTLNVRPTRIGGRSDLDAPSVGSQKTSAGQASTCPVGGIVTSFVRDAELLQAVTRHGRTVEESWSLPLSATKHFPALIRALESARVNSLDTSRGVSTAPKPMVSALTLGQTTLEDTFLEVGRRFGHKTTDGATSSPRASTPAALAGNSVTEDSDDDDCDESDDDAVRSISRVSQSAFAEPNRKVYWCAQLATSSRVICGARLKTLLRTPNAIATQVCVLSSVCVCPSLFTSC